MSKTHIAALAHIAFADRQKHRCISNIVPKAIRCPFWEIATALQATSRNDIKCVARKTTKGHITANGYDGGTALFRYPKH